MRVVLPLSDPFFKFYVKDLGPMTGWFDGSGTLATVRGFPTASSGPDLDTATMRAIVDEDTALGGGNISGGDPRWPSFAVVHTARWPTWYGEPSPRIRESPDDLVWPVVVLKFRTPRWRYVYDTPPTEPYRRIFPRDDGLAGGAARTWPLSKASQSGNRTFGGYW